MENELLKIIRKVDKRFNKFPYGLEKKPKGISSSAWLFYLHLYLQGPNFHPSQRLLSRCFDVSEKCIKDWCRELENYHYLRIVRIGKQRMSWEIYEIPY